MKLADSTVRRPYRMQARATATAATAARILDAAETLFWAEPVAEISLDRVAELAGVTVQTVIRRFQSKDGLFEAAVERQIGRVVEQRDTAPAGDLEAAVRILTDHYEELGDRVLRLLGEEDRVPGLRRLTDRGRDYHRGWCERVFDTALADLRGAARGRRLAQLIAVTDVYMWKLLRRDRALSRRQTELAMRELLEPLTGGLR
jgi:AcrR family transcriptional regulator